MITDQELTLSDSQPITAAAASSNVIDLGRLYTGNTYRDIGAGAKPLRLVITVMETFTDSGSDSTLEVKAQTDSDEAFGSATDLWTIQTIPALSAAGLQYVFTLPSGAYERYLRLYYTPGNGNLTTGKITAQLVIDAPNRRDYAVASHVNVD